MLSSQQNQKTIFGNDQTLMGGFSQGLIKNPMAGFTQNIANSPNGGFAPAGFVQKNNPSQPGLQNPLPAGFASLPVQVIKDTSNKRYKANLLQIVILL